jgi:hypothetical protein
MIRHASGVHVDREDAISLLPPPDVLSHLEDEEKLNQICRHLDSQLHICQIWAPEVMSITFKTS